MKRKIVFAEARRALHKALVTRNILSLDPSGVASNADRKNDFSCAIAKRIATELGAHTIEKKEKGQTAGAGFEGAVAEFVSTTFPRLQNLRPGNWNVARLGNKSRIKTADFAQYVIAGYVVNAGKDYYIFGVQLQNIGAETGEHMHSCLSADTPADEAVVGEPLTVVFIPVPGDGIAKQHSNRFFLDEFVTLCVIGVAGPVVPEIILCKGSIIEQ